MPSKFIAVYSHISVEGYVVEFAIPKVSVTNTAADNFTTRDLEVESSNLDGRFSYTGRFEWRVLDPHGGVVGSAFNIINSMTGNLDGGSMTSTVKFLLLLLRSVGFAKITYGFNDAGHGEVGLLNKDQCYVTVCSLENRSRMGAIAPPGSSQAQQPFSHFVLAAPHNNGMNSMQSADVVLSAIDTDMAVDLRKIIPRLGFFRTFRTPLWCICCPILSTASPLRKRRRSP